MHFLTRSFLIDIALVAVACFTLVCSIAYLQHISARIEAGQHAYWVEIEHADGSVEKYSVDDTVQSAAQLHDDLVHRMTGRPAPQVALMQWYQESSQFYAAASSQAASDTRAAKNVDKTMPADVFHTASNRHTSLAAAADQQPPQSDASSSRWQDFWSQREQHAATWLAGQEAHVKTRVASLRESIRVVQRYPWLPSPETKTTAALLSLVVLVGGCAWRLACPPRSLHCDRVAFAGLPSQPAPANAAAMCFRQSWVQPRQPANVIARAALGWAIGILALGSLAYAVISTLC